MKKSLGLIETIGLTAAIEAADAAVKSANIEVIGYELTRGDGMVTVKVEGDVGAVNAAISSAETAANRVGSVASTKVIPRPAKGLDSLVRNADTVGIEKKAEDEVQTEEPVKEPAEEKVEEPKEQIPVKDTVKKAVKEGPKESRKGGKK